MPNEKRDVDSALNFVHRTVTHGVPVRVAIQRASKRFRISREILRAFYRGDDNGWD